MIEYLFNAIRVSQGANCVVKAKISDNEGEPITEDCSLIIHNEDETISYIIRGIYNAEEDIWNFTIDETITKDLKGRYWYCISYESAPLCFKEPFYIV